MTLRKAILCLIILSTFFFQGCGITWQANNVSSQYAPSINAKNMPKVGLLIPVSAFWIANQNGDTTKGHYVADLHYKAWWNRINGNAEGPLYRWIDNLRGIYHIDPLYYAVNFDQNSVSGTPYNDKILKIQNVAVANGNLIWTLDNHNNKIYSLTNLPSDYDYLLQLDRSQPTFTANNVLAFLNVLSIGIVPSHYSLSYEYTLSTFNADKSKPQLRWSTTSEIHTIRSTLFLLTFGVFEQSPLDEESVATNMFDDLLRKCCSDQVVTSSTHQFK